MMRAALLLLSSLFLALAAPADAAITITPGQADEGGEKVKFTVTSDQLAGGAYATADDTAKANEDYKPANGNLSFAPLPGQTDSKTVEVETVDDSAAELDETFKFTFTPTGGQAITVSGKIVDKDEPTVSISDISVSEADGKAAIRVTSNPVSREVSVGYATGDDSADATDFTPTSGRLSIPAGQNGATITVPLNNDPVDENDERFRLSLGNPTGAKVGNANAFVTITNDDVRLISVGDIGVVEGDVEPTVARFPIQLSGPTFRTVTVSFVTVDGPAAKAPRDYLARSGTVTFLPGQTLQFVDIGIVSDDAIEPSEFFGVLIGQADGARILKASALAAIRDDDAGDPAGADRQSPRMQLTRPRLSGSRSIRARVSCPRGDRRCRGRLVLYGRVGGAERRIGAKTFSLPGNAARTLRISIPSSVMRRARRSGRLPLRAYLVTSDAAGNVDTKELSATLRLRRSSRAR